MNDTTPPEQWRPLFNKIGVEFGYRPLATRIGMDHTRLRRLLLGGGTSAEAIQFVADAFGVGPERIRELRGEQVTAYEPFSLPDGAGRLTHSERDVIRSMVRALLDARASGRSSDQPQTGAARLEQHQRDFRGKVHNPNDGSEKRA
ncbi:MAG: hypothetical protein K0U84_09150 [Actinomycetia bacterium]|nr:hypothetical protein [Actinomycetes bacterium]